MTTGLEHQQADAGLRTPSLRRRVTVVVVGLVAVLLVVLVVSTDLVLRERLDAQLRQRLVDRAGVADALDGKVDDRDLARRLEGEGVSVVLTTGDGEVYAEGSLAGAAGVSPAGGGSGASEGPDTGPAAPGGGPAGAPAPPVPPGATASVTQSGDLLTVRHELSDGADVLLLADARDVDTTVAQVRLALLVAALLVLLATALLVPLVVHRALRPLDRITAVARTITRGDRARRLRPTHPGTELGRTAVAFDDMLDEVVGAEGRAVTSEARLRDFLSDAAHELRTPVAGVQASAEYLLREDPARPEREEVLVGLIRETRRTGRLVDDLLLMARIDRGLALAQDPVDLRAVAEEVVAARRRTHPDARLAVTGAVTGAAAVVTGDHDRLLQTVANLVDNALQATGGTGAVTVHVGAHTLDVVDDGPGVPDADRARIFDRLVRLDDGHVRRGGSGLGLSIARGIARSHGGDLVCLPGAGSGARFRLSLPRAGATMPVSSSGLNPADQG